ncbi:hypothetical protein HW561_06635 [Rhodobacteraceae bacterium B1Z28]|uniref:Uncharacterized protein n=1 Tax=Ruegeria haliotis TaxID=2747601 RepID=A0ABX2PPX1_9RHOB|nr:hypothetical protein [Ruegeria haliotis]NVO55461.1 hypothetical protein [Ruegeria haliotis]
MLRFLLSTFLAAPTLSSPVLAGVWTETPDDPGEAVEFCIHDDCETTRYVTIGSSGNWAFFELANGYHTSTYSSALTKMSVTRASLDGKELSEQQFAAIRLRGLDDEPTSVDVPGDGRVVKITGPITKETTKAFGRILSNHPDLIGVSLDSSGGDGSHALLIGNAIWEGRLSTFIPAGARCAGACAVVFFSGYDRKAEGALSVSPLIDPKVDSIQLFDDLWTLLVHKAKNDVEIMGLYQALIWNQSVDLDQDSVGSEPISRDLPGDALNR